MRSDKMPEISALGDRGGENLKDSKTHSPGSACSFPLMAGSHRNVLISILITSPTPNPNLQGQHVHAPAPSSMNQ